jgi:DNA-binding phage protein
MSNEGYTAQRFELLEWALDECQQRLLVAAEVKVLGRGGISTVAKATGLLCKPSG